MINHGNSYISPLCSFIFLSCLSIPLEPNGSGIASSTPPEFKPFGPGGRSLAERLGRPRGRPVPLFLAVVVFLLEFFLFLAGIFELFEFVMIDCIEVVLVLVLVLVLILEFVDFDDDDEDESCTRGGGGPMTPRVVEDEEELVDLAAVCFVFFLAGTRRVVLVEEDDDDDDVLAEERVRL